MVLQNLLHNSAIVRVVCLICEAAVRSITIEDLVALWTGRACRLVRATLITSGFKARSNTIGSAVSRSGSSAIWTATLRDSVKSGDGGCSDLEAICLRG